MFNKLIFVWLILIFAITVSAQQNNLPQQNLRPSIEVSPAIINVSLSPGKTYVYPIRIRNHSQGPLPIRAVMENLEPGISSLTGWVIIEPKELLLPAGEEKIINLTVNIPKKIAIGGYYGNLFLDILSPFPQQTGESSVQPRIGVIILSNIGVQQKGPKAEISSFSFRNLFSNQDAVQFEYEVKNISLHHFSAKPFISVKPLIGAEEKYTLEEKIILPGRARQWESPIDLKNKHRGIYRASLEVSSGGGETVKKSLILFNFPVAKVFLWSALILIVLFLIKNRKNSVKAFETLFGSKKSA